MKSAKGVLLILSLFFCYSYSSATELTAKEAGKYYSAGVELQKRGDFREAEIYYQKTLILDPYSPTWQKYVINNRGVMYAQMGDLSKAEEYFNEALRLDPNYETPKLNLGFIYEKRRSKLESIEYWIKTLNIDLDSMKPKAFVVEEPKTSEK